MSEGDIGEGYGEGHDEGHEEIYLPCKRDMYLAIFFFTIPIGIPVIAFIVCNSIF